MNDKSLMWTFLGVSQRQQPISMMNMMLSLILDFKQETITDSYCDIIIITFANSTVKEKHVN